MIQFRVRTLLALPLLVASLFAAAQAIRQHGVKFADGKTAIALNALVVGAMALAFLAAAVWSTLKRRVLLLRTTIAGVTCFCLTLAWLHAFPHLFDPRNLLLRAAIIFLLLFMPSLAIAWTVKIAVSLIRWARTWHETAKSTCSLPKVGPPARRSIYVTTSLRVAKGTQRPSGLPTFEPPGDSGVAIEATCNASRHGLRCSQRCGALPATRS